MIPDRVKAMCQDLFKSLCDTGGPEQKTIIFCARDAHADNVAIEMNNLYAEWCASQGITGVNDYAFKCTAGRQRLRLFARLPGQQRALFRRRHRGPPHHPASTFPASATSSSSATSTPPSPSTRWWAGATRLDTQTNKLMFRVYDYTDATRLFGQDSRTAFTPEKPQGEIEDDPKPPKDGPRSIVVTRRGCANHRRRLIHHDHRRGRARRPALPGGIQAAAGRQAGREHSSPGRLPHRLDRPGLNAEG